MTQAENDMNYITDDSEGKQEEKDETSLIRGVNVQSL